MRADENQGRIIKALREIGASVIVLSQVGGGCPDILVGYRGINYLMEIKGPRGKLSERQIAFHESWRGGEINVIRSVGQGIKTIGG